MDNLVKYDYKKLTPFKWFVLQNFPFIEADFDAITNYQLFCKVVEYLNKTIESMNTTGEVVEEFTQKFIDLQNFVNDYFNNLDVQDEINNKLDQMTQSGELSNLIKPYLDNLTNNVNQNINALNNKIDTILTLTPQAVNSVDAMTDKSKLYLNTADGYWYYYNGSSFVQGGLYQSPNIPDNSITPDKININAYSKLKNIYVNDYFLLNSHILGYKTINNVKFIDIQSGDPDSRKIIKFPLDGVTKIQFNYPYKVSQAWGRAYQVTKEDGELIDNSDILFANYNSLTNNQAEFCTFNNESKIVTLDITSMRTKYPDIKEIYIAIYEYATWTIQANAFIIYYYPIQNIQWLDLSYLASKTYVDEKINNINYNTNYDSLNKSNLYEICAYGDSLTENGNGATSYTDYLKKLIDNNKISILNFGKGGQSSGTIAWRQGGLKIKTTKSFNMPEDNQTQINVPITISSGNILNFTGVNTNLDCVISGIECIMSVNVSDSSVNINRKNNGNSVNIPANTIIESTQNNYNNDLQIIWVGKNDIPNAADYQISGVLENIQAMINYLSPSIKRFIVLSIITSTTQIIGTTQYNTIMEINNKLKELYPNNYVDIQDYLVHQCIYDMKLTPTESDLQDIQNGTIPRQLLSDGIHPNPECREYISKFIYNNLFNKTWIIK